MQEELITFETAKLAKQKGFNIEALNFYTKPKSKMFGIDEHGRSYSAHNTPKKLYTIGKDAALNIESVYPAPTQSLLQKWLREVHNCFIDILPHRDGDSKNKQWKNKEDVFWTVEVDYYGKNFEIKLTNNADFTQHFNKSYEEALEIALFEALKLIK